jgi:hypothetical protein
VNYPIDALTLKKIAHNYGVTDHLPARARLKIPFALPKKLKAGEKLKVRIFFFQIGKHFCYSGSLHVRLA